MSLINDHDFVLLEEPVAADFGQQHPVRQQFDERLRTRLIGEAHFVADLFTERSLHLFRDSRGDTSCRDAAGLRVADHAGDTEAGVETDFGQLRGLA